METRSLRATRPAAARRYAAWAGIALGLLAFAYAAASWYLWANQRALIVQPRRVLERSPAAPGLQYEEVHVPVPGAPAAHLHGWWLPSTDPAAPLLLYLHGHVE